MSPERGMAHNGRATTADPVAARELSLFIENEYSLVGAPNSMGKSIDANLRRKLQSGDYKSALAPKAWQHLIDEGAKKYEREFGTDRPIFNAATRRSVAADFARAWEEENEASSTSRELRKNGMPHQQVEQLVARVFSHSGNVLSTYRGTNVQALIRSVDREHHPHSSATIRGEFTSDGTRHMPGAGRILASRDGSSSGWVME